MSSSSVPTNTKTIPSIGGARGSPVLTPSPDDPYMLVRQTYLPTALDTESEPFEDSLETEEPQSLSPTSAPPSPDYTTATPHTNDELESFETFETRVTSSPSFTLPVDPTSPHLPRGHYLPRHHLPLHLHDHSTTDTESAELEDKDTDSKDEETTPEGRRQQAILAEDAAEDEPLGLGYGVARRHALELPIRTTLGDLEEGTIHRDIECDLPSVRSPVRASPAPVQTPPASPKWFLESSSVSLVIHSLVASPAPAVALDEGALLDIGAQLELHASVLHIYSERLDALPPSHFEGYDRDFTELYFRTEAVRKEIHTQRFRLRGLEQGHEKTGITIDWFKQPPRSPTPDSEWNKRQVVLDQPEQPWFNQMVFASKDPFTFNDLMATPIDFSKYVLNGLKIENLTQDILLGTAFNLLKGTCSSSIELEYNFQECFNMLTDKLDWNNPQGDRYPFDLSKPLPLQGPPARYDIKGIEDMVPTVWSIIKHGYDKDALKEIKHWGERHKLWHRS
ncbi:hypothetical protein Tco_0735419 [Tanacetum coccineum]